MEDESSSSPPPTSSQSNLRCPRTSPERSRSIPEHPRASPERPRASQSIPEHPQSVPERRRRASPEGHPQSVPPERPGASQSVPERPQSVPEHPQSIPERPQSVPRSSPEQSFFDILFKHKERMFLHTRNASTSLLILSLIFWQNAKKEFVKKCASFLRHFI